MELTKNITNKTKKNTNSNRDLSQRVFEVVCTIGVAKKTQSISYDKVPLFKNIQKNINQNKKLTFILPAFPAKSSNSDKTCGVGPDFGEVIGLRILNAICDKINSFYNPGAEVVICSDGRVFNDIVFVNDVNLIKYKNGIKKIIKNENLINLKTFSLDDCFDHQNFELMRQNLVEEYAPSVDSLRHLVKKDSSFCQMFNGVHRFMKEDLSHLQKNLSKNQVMKISKKLTYQVIQRSKAWDELLKNYFPSTLRLSIHPYPITHEKFGVQLVPSRDSWATPWHNVVLKDGDRYVLTKRKQAVAMGAQIKFAEGKYAYYQAS